MSSHTHTFSAAHNIFIVLLLKLATGVEYSDQFSFLHDLLHQHEPIFYILRCFLQCVQLLFLQTLEREVGSFIFKKIAHCF